MNWPFFTSALFTSNLFTFGPFFSKMTGKSTVKKIIREKKTIVLTTATLALRWLMKNLLMFLADVFPGAFPLDAPRLSESYNH